MSEHLGSGAPTFRLMLPDVHCESPPSSDVVMEVNDPEGPKYPCRNPLSLPSQIRRLCRKVSGSTEHDDANAEVCAEWSGVEWSGGEGTGGFLVFGFVCPGVGAADRGRWSLSPFLL